MVGSIFCFPHPYHFNIMGLIFLHQGKQGTAVNADEYNLATGWIWVVIRRDAKITPAEWHLQGLAADEDLAVQMCIDDTYLIGPFPLNQALPHDGIEWVGCYFPLKKRVEK